MVKSFAEWEFWIDRGGTFTDIVARNPEGELITHKLLSENPEQYDDAALQGIREIVELGKDETISSLKAVKMGTTVATNALLERKGEPTVLVTTKGFRDGLRIAYQNRPKLFDRHIKLPELLYEKVVEVDERLSAQGSVVKAISPDEVRAQLQPLYDQGYRSIAVVFMHAYRFPDHEKTVADIAQDIGFTNISLSHEVSALMKYVSRGDTTVVDAYVSPILKRYVDKIKANLDQTPVLFMQSSGGLIDANRFRGKNSILSGPAGGVVGAVKTAAMSGLKKIIGFDMGGTSTDVSHYNGEYERSYETQVAGVRMRAPMMNIHTVAAGGGSICTFDGTKFRVGPESAGANPGPACYRRGGPLTVTDCNVMLGKVIPELFPKVFGPNADQALDKDIVEQKFAQLSQDIKQATGKSLTPYAIADGFIKIAVDNMANAIKQISVQKGYDITQYALVSFGGAGGQHAALVADALGIKKIFIHPLAGVLSAYGMGLADQSIIREKAVEKQLNNNLLSDISHSFDDLENTVIDEMSHQGFEKENLSTIQKVFIRYDGTDKALPVSFNVNQEMLEAAFEKQYLQVYGFLMRDKSLVVESISVEVVAHTAHNEKRQVLEPGEKDPDLEFNIELYSQKPYPETPVYLRKNVFLNHKIKGPAIIVDDTATTVIEKGWQASINDENHLIMERYEALPSRVAVGTEVDPIMLEIFNNLFMSIAEQMGLALENTAYSVNIKERLDFSCALFDSEGNLVANAPHMPVHLGSMSESVRAVIKDRKGEMKPGDVYALNTPYNGGTHLPDITVITPVFDQKKENILFYVGSRGHHADVGGITPGSMPPNSQTIHEEGILIDNFLLVSEGEFLEKELRDLFSSCEFPARNIVQNIADLKAQIAACEKGIKELDRMISQFGLDVVQAYMVHVRDNAAEQVRMAINKLKSGSFTYEMDDGSVIKVSISIDQKYRTAIVDFTGTSLQQETNFNAPSAVCRAAVLYVFRTLVDDEIPMNEGCLEPIKIIIPEQSMLNPVYPAAVVAGNVETSQCITDALYGALGVMSAAQGTMNNFTFGNDQYQYYETICGGSGAGEGFDGTSAVHTHMTNSRLTDPEILEWRFPVELVDFYLRKQSGGKGKYKGGDGVVRKMKFLEPMIAAILSNHRRVAPFGLQGGESGKVGCNYILSQQQKIELKATDSYSMKNGDIIVIETPGGGGFGQENNKN